MGSQFIGLSVMRYIGRIEPLASATVDELVTAIGPTVQRYLTGDIGNGVADAVGEDGGGPATAAGSGAGDRGQM